MRIDYPRAARRGPLRFLPSWRQVLALVVLGVALAVGGFAAAYATTELPPPNSEVLKQTSTVYYSDGKQVIGTFGDVNRTVVPLARVPVHVRRAVLAAEDRTFYENQGVNPTSIVRAALANARNEATQGGSTITQQYVKNVYLTQERTLSRKAKEFLLALKVNREISKDQILENYLNAIYWGRGTSGIQAASRAYFGKDVDRLSVSEGAFLAGVIQSPSRYEPTRNRSAAQRRWAYVLDGMVAKGWLTPAQRAGQRFPKTVKRTTEQRFAGEKGYLLDAVRGELAADGVDEAEVETGGLRIRSTFDASAQRAAEDAVKTQFPTTNSKRVQVGLAAVKPGDGAVVAMYGGPDFLTDQVNNATEDRTLLGSTVKPFTLAAALEDGVSLRSRFAGNSPLRLPGGGKPVRNEFGTSYGSRVDLYKATRDSINTAFVDLTLEVGAGKVRDAMEAAGLDRTSGTRGLNADARITLGTADSNPLAVAGAYATIAAGGTRVDPYLVAEVKGPDGAVRYRAAPKRERDVFGGDSEDIASDVTDALHEVVTSGSGTAALALGRPAAGKTGTAAETVRGTSYNLSAWFSGFTPQLATSVAYFRQGKTIPQRSLDGVGGQRTFFGAGYPTRTWTAFMKGALEGEPVEQLPTPAHLGEIRHAVPVAPPSSSAPPSPSAPSSSASSSAPPPSDSSPPSSPQASTSPPSPTPRPTSTPTRSPSATTTSRGPGPSGSGSTRPISASPTPASTRPPGAPKPSASVVRPPSDRADASAPSARSPG